MAASVRIVVHSERRRKLISIVFLRDWLESCRQVGKSGWDDMPWEWEPYLPNDDEVLVGPTTYLNKPPEPMWSTKRSFVSVVTSTAAAATSLPVASLSLSLSTLATTSNPTSILSTTFDASTTSASPESTAVISHPIIVTSRTLSPGAIGGIVAGILFLVALLGIIGCFYWKANKKAQQKNREVAILSDRVSGCGFQRYIDELLADSDSSAGTVMRHDVPTLEVAEMSGQAVGVHSRTSSVYSVGIARAM